MNLARFAGRDIRWFDSIDSTMLAAARLAIGGCPSGTVVGAEEQTAGQGRYGRRWHSERAGGLYLSLVLRLPLPPDSLPLLTLALGLAVSDAITQTAGLACDLRWPNDVLAGGRKCAGILTQLHDTAVVAGIGINVNQSEFPADVAALATSLRIVTGREHSREDLLDYLLASVDAYCKMLMEEGKDAILEAFTHASSYVRGRRVVVEQGDSVVRGVTEGLDAAGFLLLRQDDGKRTIILAGGVRPA